MTMHLIKSRDSANMKDLKYNINLDNGTFIYVPETEEDMIDEDVHIEGIDEEDIF